MTDGRRVISLVPSVTETLRAWGHDPVACTRFCEQPDLPHVGGTKDPDIARILAWAPDLVVVDEEENRREDAEALVAAGVEITVTAVRSVGDVAPTLVRLAAAVGVPTPTPVERRPEVEPTTRSAFVPIWRRPWMTLNGDTYGSSVLATLGCGNVFADHSKRYPVLDDLEEVRDRRPDVVLAPSEPFPFGERHRTELGSVAPVRFVDGQDLFWWGVRTPDALDRLRAVLR